MYNKYEEICSSVLSGLSILACEQTKWRAEITEFERKLRKCNQALTCGPYEEACRFFVLDGYDIPNIAKHEALVIIDFSDTDEVPTCSTTQWIDRGLTLPKGWVYSYIPHGNSPIHWCWFCAMREGDIVRERREKIHYDGFELSGLVKKDTNDYVSLLPESLYWRVEDIMRLKQ